MTSPLKPGALSVLAALRDRGDAGLTHLEALMGGLGSRLSGRVHELRAAGYDITSTYVTTSRGERVVRYRLNESRPAPMTGTQQGLSL